MLHEALDRAALARGVTPLEQDDDLLSRGLDSVLNLEQLKLQFSLLFLIVLAL
jgi:aryl carrier-like protein